MSSRRLINPAEAGWYSPKGAFVAGNTRKRASSLVLIDSPGYPGVCWEIEFPIPPYPLIPWMRRDALTGSLLPAVTEPAGSYEICLPTARSAFPSINHTGTQTMESFAMSNLSRRRFLATTGAVAAGAVFAGPAPVRAKNLNDRMNVAAIAVGGRGGANVNAVAGSPMSTLRRFATLRPPLWARPPNAFPKRARRPIIARFSINPTNSMP